MSNIKTFRNTYWYMNDYPEYKNVSSNIDNHITEKFLSLYAAVRRPFSIGYGDPTYIQPSVPGVN